MNILNDNDVILLLGAGASAEAGIKFTNQMIEDLEHSLETDAKAKSYQNLYQFIKEQKQLLSKDNPLNIEELVNIIDEMCLLIDKKHPLSLINLSWVSFMEKMGYTTILLREFKDVIFDKLKEWIPIEDKLKPNYYNSIAKFQIKYGSNLRIFTLNYDKCIEEYCHTVNNNDVTENEGRNFNLIIERGFGDERETDNNKEWEYKRFIEEGKNAHIYLYKMHGSIDWERNKNDKTERHNNINTIKNFDIIFGTTHKLKAYDPYLFFMYEFRDRTLNSKIIAISGYGFGDDHINRIITQAFENGKEKPRLLINLYDKDEVEGIEFVKMKLNITMDENRIVIVRGEASSFFKNNLNIEYLNNLYYGEEGAIELPF